MATMTKERATKLVWGYTAAQRGRDEAKVDLIAERMVTHNEGVWHASSVVLGKLDTCWCGPCKQARGGK